MQFVCRFPATWTHIPTQMPPNFFGLVFDRLRGLEAKDPAQSPAFAGGDKLGGMWRTQYASFHLLLLDTHDSLRFERSRWRIDPLLL
jgi:hypothetical protein